MGVAGWRRMNGAAAGWVFWLQFWRLWLFGDRPAAAEFPHHDPLPAPRPERSARVIDLAAWRREHRGAA